MPLESATYISDLVATNPTGSDAKSTADDHLRLTKSVLKASLPNVAGAVSASHTELSYVTGVTSPIQTQFGAKGAVAGQVWTGAHDCTGATVTVATQATSDNTTKAASTAFVNALVTATSLSSALPTQATHADQVPTTDGATASWTPNLKATVIRFKDGADASKLMAFDVSGVTTATTRTLAVPNKSGTLAMLSDTGMTLLATLTPTAAANVDFLTAFSATYDQYLIVGDGLKPAADDLLKFRFANAGTADAGSNYFTGGIESVTAVTISTTSGFVAASTVTSAGIGCGFVMHVMNANDATNLKAALGKYACQTNATPGYAMNGAHTSYAAANAISGIRFFWNGGANFAATGRIRVYGISN